MIRDKSYHNCNSNMEQVTRIELALAAWKAVVLPLNHTCKKWSGKQDSNLRHLGPKPSALPS